MAEIEKYFNQLSEFLLNYGVPKWETELFAENLYVDHRSKQIIDRQMLYDLIEFSEPFASLISEGYQTDIILKAIKANNFLHLTGVPLPLHTVR